MDRAFRLYNTLTRSVEPFVPADPNRVQVYTCGPTVYGRAHIGNLRTYIAEDVLVKALRYAGYGVHRVMNITDVGHLTSDQDEGEDKMEVGAKREGKTAWQIARQYEQLFVQDMEQLGIEVPTDLIRATDTIAEQIELIKILENKGFTYITSDGVYFDSAKVPDYGKLARLDVAGLEPGARVEFTQEKRHISDFALWKFSPSGAKRDMEWESPWGVGFPGWHVECSAIILKSLGESIDIHCGGSDHIPVHHTNEIAQSESATGKPLSRTWFHTGFLQVDGGRMGKSLGNGYTVEDIKEQGIDPLSFRAFVYSAQYRSTLNFTWDALRAADQGLKHLRQALREGGEGENDLEMYCVKLKNAITDDLNIPAVVAILWEVARSNLRVEYKRQLAAEIDQILSLDLLRSSTFDIPEEVQQLLKERELARLHKDWEQSDRLRDQVQQLGFVILDTKEGQHLTQE